MTTTFIPSPEQWFADFVRGPGDGPAVRKFLTEVIAFQWFTDETDEKEDTDD